MTRCERAREFCQKVLQDPEVWFLGMDWGRTKEVLPVRIVLAELYAAALDVIEAIPPEIMTGDLGAYRQIHEVLLCRFKLDNNMEGDHGGKNING